MTVFIQATIIRAMTLQRTCLQLLSVCMRGRTGLCVVVFLFFCGQQGKLYKKILKYTRKNRAA